MLKKLLLAVVALVGLVVVLNYAVFSAKFRYEVEREMAAKPAAIVGAMQDLRTWDQWSPWSRSQHEGDGSQFTYEGDPGPGMTWRWAGGKELGDGWLKITRVAKDAVDYEMAMQKPMEMGLKGGITLVPAGDKTKVTWWSAGEQDMPGVGRIMNTVFAGAVKKDYATALEGLESHAQGR